MVILCWLVATLSASAQTIHEEAAQQTAGPSFTAVSGSSLGGSGRHAQDAGDSSRKAHLR